MARKTRHLGFWLDVVAICWPGMALWLLLAATQANLARLPLTRTERDVHQAPGFQALGPITVRLLLAHGDRAEDCAAWWPPRTAHPYARPAADGWHCGHHVPAGRECALSVSASPAPDRPGPTPVASAA